METKRPLGPATRGLLTAGFGLTPVVLAGVSLSVAAAPAMSELAAGQLAGSGETEASAAPGPSSVAQTSDTIRVPRADTVPVPDCEIAEWPATGRIELRPGLAGVYSRGVVEGGEDMTARLELVWTEDALHLLADVRDDWVLPGVEEGGDWIQLRLGGKSVWIPAPGPRGSVAVVGTPATGEPVRRSSGCRTDYGWTAEATLPAGLLPRPPRLGIVLGFRTLVEDEDAGSGAGRSVLWREGRLLFTTAETSLRTPASDTLLQKLRAPTTLEELSRRPGARDTTIVLEGRRYPAVRVPVADVPVTAFAPARDTSAVTYWIGPGSEEALERLGLRRSVAALRRELGALQRESEDVGYARPRVRFELLPGVVFQLGLPGGAIDRIPGSAVPQGVFVETRRPGEGGS